jgi:hypothetical protein
LPHQAAASHEFAKVGVPHAASSIGERKSMSTNRDYRINAEDCLRLARTAQDKGEKPFWINLAQSWLMLAEHSAREDSQAQDREVGADAH